MNTKTYDAYINGIFKQGLSMAQLKSYRLKGYSVEIITSYSTSDKDYNSIAIKNNYY